MNNLKEITLKSDWGEWDQLDGYTLKADETLIIEWPNGDLEQVSIAVESEPWTVSDMGHPYTTSKSHAFVWVTYKGAMAKVPLRGIRAQRVSK